MNRWKLDFFTNLTVYNSQWVSVQSERPIERPRHAENYSTMQEAADALKESNTAANYSK